MSGTMAEAPEAGRSAHQLVIERKFAAPRELVWKMFADPYHLCRWWGPTGFTNPVCEMDLRPGGRWYHVMRSPAGNDYPADSEFVEVAPPERIVWRNRELQAAAFGDNPPPSFLRMLSLIDLGDGTTLLRIDCWFATAEEMGRVIARGFREGTMQSLDRLADELAGIGTS